jgi:hypothetical protein
MHLSPEQLIDIAEGVRPESGDPHLGSCDVCRREVALLREAIVDLGDSDVPEPSPLFWEHLSGRVREAIADEAPDRRRRARWSLTTTWWPAATIAGVAAALALAVHVSAPPPSPPVPAASGLAETATIADPFAALDAADDASLALVADLAGQLDAEVLADTRWTDRADAIDHAVASLSDDERVELRRLLEEALARRGA